MSVEAPTRPAQLDEIVTRYLQLRDAKADKKKAYEAEVKEIDTAMTRIENFLLNHLNTCGASSVKTDVGTFFKKTSTKVTTGDRDEFLGFVRKSEAWALLEVRPSKSAVEQYRDEHNDLPPGINYSEYVEVQVRR